MTELRYKILGRNRLKDLQPPSYLIPRILPEKGLVTLVAEPSSKKSFLAVHMASCVATGTPFCDIPTNKGNIVYIAAEGQFGIRKRISAWEVEQVFVAGFNKRERQGHGAWTTVIFHLSRMVLSRVWG